MHPKAEAPLEEAVALWRTADAPAQLARGLIALGEVRDSQLRYEDAEQLYREALALAVPLEDEGLHADAENGLGRALRGQGRYDEAEALYTAALARLRARHDALHPDVTAAERSLAFVFIDQGRLEDGEALLLGLRDRLAADDPRRLDVLAPLTFLYLAANRTDDAARTGAEAVALARVVRPGSSTFSQVLAAYAAVLRRQGRLAEAEAAYREALTLPPIRPEAHAVPLGGLASVLADRGDLDGAAEAQEQAVALLRAAGSPSVAFSTVKLAGFLRDLRRFAEAERLLLDAEAAARVGRPSTHPGSNPIPAALASLYEAWGRPDDAARWRASGDR
jgi:serine/threonine-protein kinase